MHSLLADEFIPIFCLRISTHNGIDESNLCIYNDLEIAPFLVCMPVFNSFFYILILNKKFRNLFTIITKKHMKIKSYVPLVTEKSWFHLKFAHNKT